jgi:fluoroquinolone transport system permease protein
MTSRSVALIRHDLRLQYRYGIYAAYAVVVAVYVAELLLLGGALPRWVPALIVFTDPAAVSFFFLGALLMLEKSEGVRAALAATPVTAANYLTGKAVTLVGLSLASSALLIPFMQDGVNPALMLLTVGLTAIQYLGIGVPIGLRFKTVNGYLIGSGGFLMPLIAPGLLALLDPFPLVSALIPAVSQFRLLLVATGAASATKVELALMLSVITLAAIGAILFALWSLRRELGK